MGSGERVHSTAGLGYCSGFLFLWQFPHFHAIAWMYREDYARAGILMLPVVDPEGKRTFRQIILTAFGIGGRSFVACGCGAGGDVSISLGRWWSASRLLQVCLWASTLEDQCSG